MKVTGLVLKPGICGGRSRSALGLPTEDWPEMLVVGEVPLARVQVLTNSKGEEVGCLYANAMDSCYLNVWNDA